MRRYARICWADPPCSPKVARENPDQFLDQDYQEEWNSRLEEFASYLIVRKGDELVYCGSSSDIRKLFTELPVRDWETEEL